MVKKICETLCVTLLIVLLGGCMFMEASDEKIKDRAFVIVNEEALPEEIRSIIETKKTEAFQMAYHEANTTYIILGYGMQETSGYSIQVNEVYEGKDSIWVDADLIGPRKNDVVENEPSYPYVIIKTEKIEQLIRFKI